MFKKRPACEHDWDEGVVVFNESIVESFRAPRSMGEDLALKAVYGVSTITQRCTKCHALTSSTVPGRIAMPPMSRLSAAS